MFKYSYTFVNLGQKIRHYVSKEYINNMLFSTFNAMKYFKSNVWTADMKRLRMFCNFFFTYCRRFINMYDVAIQIIC
jgi:hypothetical protein